MFPFLGHPVECHAWNFLVNVCPNSCGWLLIDFIKASRISNLVDWFHQISVHGRILWLAKEIRFWWLQISWKFRSNRRKADIFSIKLWNRLLIDSLSFAMLLLRRSNVACLFFHTLILSVINQGRVWALMYGGGRSNGVVQRGLRLHRLRHHDRQLHQHGGQCENFHHSHPHICVLVIYEGSIVI